MPIEAVFSSKPNRSNKVICPDLLDCLAKAPLSGLLCSPHQEPASLCWLQPRGKGRVGWVGRGNALLLPLHLHSPASGLQVQGTSLLPSSNPSFYAF